MALEAIGEYEFLRKKLSILSFTLGIATFLGSLGHLEIIFGATTGAMYLSKSLISHHKIVNLKFQFFSLEIH